MAMIPYMAGGYAIDKLMGGRGTTGLALGTGLGALGTGVFSSALAPELTATELAGGMQGVGSIPAASSKVGILGTSPANMITSNSLGALDIATTPTSLLSPSTLAEATANPSLFEMGQRNLSQGINYVEDFISPATDFINESYENMSLTDKLSMGMLGGQAIDTATATPEQAPLQVAPPQMKPAEEPTIGAPLAINVSSPNTTFYKDPRKLYEERMYG
jgi:hypothetical protein